MDLGPRPASAFLFPQLVQAKIDDDSSHPRHKAGFALELFEALPGFDPGFLRKIHRLFLVAHHAECPRINFIPMPGDQFLERLHVAFLGCINQGFVFSGRVIEFPRHRFDVVGWLTIQSSQSLPLVEGKSPEMRGSRWQAKSTAFANALNSASTTWCGSPP